MKNFYLLLFVFGTINFSIAQENENVIYANSTKNSTLIFPTAIKRAIVGSSNFAFGYNKTDPSNIGILKSTGGEESNLLVITDNGSIYSFTIRYERENNNDTYFFTEAQSVGNESGVKSPAKNENNSNVATIAKPITINSFQAQEETETDIVYDKLCLLEIEKNDFFKRIYGTSNRISIKLKNISYIQNELYFTVYLKNESSLDYDINYLNFYITSKNKLKNTTSQTIPYRAKYIYNLPSKIPAGQEIQAVFVYDKFSINDNKILLLEMSEDKGERIVKLEIPNTFINNPN